MEERSRHADITPQLQPSIHPHSQRSLTPAGAIIVRRRAPISQICPRIRNTRYHAKCSSKHVQADGRAISSYTRSTHRLCGDLRFVRAAGKRLQSLVHLHPGNVEVPGPICHSTKAPQASPRPRVGSAGQLIGPQMETPTIQSSQSAKAIIENALGIYRSTCHARCPDANHVPYPAQTTRNPEPVSMISSRLVTPYPRTRS